MTAGPKRSKFQRAKHLAQITKWYLAGMTQAEIGQRLMLTQQQVSYDLKKLRLEWLKSAMVNLNEAKAKELAKIDNLEREYWEAWERSKEDHQIKTQKATPDPRSPNVGRVKEQSERVEDSVGDPRFLAGVQWCVSKRCEILGLNAGLKNLNIDLSVLTDRQVERIANGEDLLNVIADPSSSRA